MYNYFMLIGKLDGIKEIDNETCLVSVIVNDEFKSINGELKTKKFDVYTTSYIKYAKGDAIAIKGKLDYDSTGNIKLCANRIIRFERSES